MGRYGCRRWPGRSFRWRPRCSCRWWPRRHCRRSDSAGLHSVSRSCIRCSHRCRRCSC